MSNDLLTAIVAIQQQLDYRGSLVLKLDLNLTAVWQVMSGHKISQIRLQRINISKYYFFLNTGIFQLIDISKIGEFLENSSFFKVFISPATEAIFSSNKQSNYCF